jgi:hypothetical protein
MNPSAERRKEPARAEIETKNQTENGVFRSKTTRPRTTNSDFSIEIQHDSYTAEVSALPPSF